MKTEMKTLHLMLPPFPKRMEQDVITRMQVNAMVLFLRKLGMQVEKLMA